MEETTTNRGLTGAIAGHQRTNQHVWVNTPVSYGDTGDPTLALRGPTYVAFKPTSSLQQQGLAA